MDATPPGDDSDFGGTASEGDQSDREAAPLLPRQGRRDVSDGDVEAHAAGADMTIRVRCSDGVTHEITLPPSSSVKVLKQKLLAGPMKKSAGKQLRFIHAGRILKNDAVSVRDAGIGDGHCIHVLVSDPPAQSRLVPVAAAAPGGEGEGDEDATGRGEALAGFDRLRAAGLSAEDVSAVRAMFANEVAQLLATVPERGDEDPVHHFRRVEDIWMTQQGPDSEFALNLRERLEQAGMAVSIPIQDPDGARGMNALALRMQRREGFEEEDEMYTVRRGNANDFVWGFVLGFFFGFFMLFCAAQRFVPRMQKLGIVAGVLCNVAFTIMRQQQAQSA